MPRKYILAGESLGTERPFLDKRFDNLSNISVDFGGEEELVSLAYDTRNRNPVTTNPILWLAGDGNKKIYACDSKTLQVIESFNYPTSDASGMAPPQQCFGLALLSEPTSCTLVFLSEPGLDDTDCPILFHLTYIPGAATPQERLVVKNWYYVNTTGASSIFSLHEDNRGMTEYRGDLMILGRYNNVNTVMYLDKFGMPLATYPAFEEEDKLKGLLHIHDRVYTTMDGTDNARIGGRFLAKFITPEIDNQPGSMIPLISIEPFFLPTFNGDMAIYQDRMAACDRDRVYLYKMLYFCFIVDDMHNDDIDMGSILIGESKVKGVKLKNIADYYKLKDVSLKKGTVTCPDAAAHCPASEALAWVKLSVTDPATTTSEDIWLDTISLATSEPYIAPDGEREFWVKIEVPTVYENLTESGGGAKAVSVDDGPFVIPLEITAKVG